MALTAAQLGEAMPSARNAGRIARFVDPLNAAMAEFAIGTGERQAAFLAQVAVESGQLLYVKELGTDAEHEKAYGGRKDLGNIDPGDGARYCGRGLIQITGRSNYEACGIGLRLPLILHPELLEQPEGACRSAAWFWSTHELNALADLGTKKFWTICRRVNGGDNGMDERIDFWLALRRVLVLP